MNVPTTDTDKESGMAEKRFRLNDLNGQDVMGGTLTLDNPYVSSYGVVKDGYKPARDLDVDEVSRQTFSLSGQKPTDYFIVRVA